MAELSFKIVKAKGKRKSYNRRTFNPDAQRRFGHRSITTSSNKLKDTPVSHGYHLEDYNRQCVYEHYYNNEEKPFYVGQGTLQRAFVFNGQRRNNNYNAKAVDVNLIRVKIVAIDIDNKKGIEIETELIKKYKFIKDGGTLVNYIEGGRGGAVDKSKKAVIQCDIYGEPIKVWNSIKEASVALNIDPKGISLCCKNAIGFKTRGGYKWKFQ